MSELCPVDRMLSCTHRGATYCNGPDKCGVDIGGFKATESSAPSGQAEFALLGDFPMQDGPDIPMALAQEIYTVYSEIYGKQQSLKRLAERGGFYWAEIPDMWKRKKRTGL